MEDEAAAAATDVAPPKGDENVSDEVEKPVNEEGTSVVVRPTMSESPNEELCPFIGVIGFECGAGKPEEQGDERTDGSGEETERSVNGMTFPTVPGLEWVFPKVDLRFGDPDERWPHLASRSFPDGVENQIFDYNFFDLADPQYGRLYGISCFRQLLGGSDSRPRHGQKSIVVLSRVPLFGLVHARLHPVVQMYYSQNNFLDRKVLIDFRASLNSTVLPRNHILMESEFCEGLPLRGLVKVFRHSLLTILKLVLLERRVVIYAQPPNLAPRTAMGICSFIPGLLRSMLPLDILADEANRLKLVDRDPRYPMMRLQRRLSPEEVMRIEEAPHYLPSTSDNKEVKLMKSSTVSQKKAVKVERAEKTKRSRKQKVKDQTAKLQKVKKLRSKKRPEDQQSSSGRKLIDAEGQGEPVEEDVEVIEPEPEHTEAEKAEMTGAEVERGHENQPGEKLIGTQREKPPRPAKPVKPPKPEKPVVPPTPSKIPPPLPPRAPRRSEKSDESKPSDGGHGLDRRSERQDLGDGESRSAAEAEGKETPSDFDGKLTEAAGGRISGDQVGDVPSETRQRDSAPDVEEEKEVSEASAEEVDVSKVSADVAGVADSRSESEGDNGNDDFSGTDDEKEKECTDGVHCGTDDEKECTDGVHCGTDDEKECTDGVHCGTDDEKECTDGVHCGTDDEKEEPSSGQNQPIDERRSGCSSDEEGEARSQEEVREERSDVDESAPKSEAAEPEGECNADDSEERKLVPPPRPPKPSPPPNVSAETKAPEAQKAPPVPPKPIGDPLQSVLRRRSSSVHSNPHCAPLMAQPVKLDKEVYPSMLGLPLDLFGQGSFFAEPFVSPGSFEKLQSLSLDVKDLMEQGESVADGCGYLVGCSNLVFKAETLGCHAFVNVERASIALRSGVCQRARSSSGVGADGSADAADLDVVRDLSKARIRDLKEALVLTQADMRFMDQMISVVDSVDKDCEGFMGSDAWVRLFMARYLECFLILMAGGLRKRVMTEKKEVEKASSDVAEDAAGNDGCVSGGESPVAPEGVASVEKTEGSLDLEFVNDYGIPFAKRWLSTRNFLDWEKKITDELSGLVDACFVAHPGSLAKGAAAEDLGIGVQSDAEDAVAERTKSKRTKKSRKSEVSESAKLKKEKLKKEKKVKERKPKEEKVRERKVKERKVKEPKFKEPKAKESKHKDSKIVKSKSSKHKKLLADSEFPADSKDDDLDVEADDRTPQEDGGPLGRSSVAVELEPRETTEVDREEDDQDGSLRKVTIFALTEGAVVGDVEPPPGVVDPVLPKRQMESIPSVELFSPVPEASPASMKKGKKLGGFRAALTGSARSKRKVEAAPAVPEVEHDLEELEIEQEIEKKMEEERRLRRAQLLGVAAGQGPIESPPPPVRPVEKLERQEDDPPSSESDGEVSEPGRDAVVESSEGVDEESDEDEDDEVSARESSNESEDRLESANEGRDPEAGSESDFDMFGDGFDDFRGPRETLSDESDSSEE